MQFAAAAASLAFGLFLVIVYSYVPGSSGPAVLLMPGALVCRGLVQLACAAGLWMVRSFGRRLALALAWIAVLGGVARLVLGFPPVMPVAALGIPMTPLVAGLSGIGVRGIPDLVSIITLVYLHTPRIGALFVRGSTP
jgi:hypothetical protein